MVVFLAVVIVAVALVVLLTRAAAAAGQGRGVPGSRPQRRPRPPRTARRVLAPDDDPEFLRELGRRARREGGNPPA